MRQKKSSERIGWREAGFIIVAFAAILLSTTLIFSGREDVGRTVEDASLVNLEDLSTEGFVQVRPDANVVEGRGVISLTGNCYRMVAGTDETLAESIRDGIDGVTNQRPNTHEVMRDLLESFDIDLLMVKVTELRENNFYGKIIVQRNDDILVLDSKPSDGIGLAVRMNGTIYFNETLLKERGQKVC